MYSGVHTSTVESAYSGVYTCTRGPLVSLTRPSSAKLLIIGSSAELGLVNKTRGPHKYSGVCI